MGARLDLHEILVTVVGSRQVYFQPPSTKVIKYPCIVYQRSEMNTKYANDKVYDNKIGYMATVIDADPDSPIPLTLLLLPMCRFDRHYTADNLNHDVYILYY